MQKITIVSLIYQSPSYAISFYNSILRSTPEISLGTAEFFFVANNANSATKRALDREKIPHYIFEAPILTDSEHSALGFSKPEYIGRVYAAYNFAVLKSKTELILLLNSDMVMSHGWLPRLLSVSSPKVALSPTLVERRHPKFGVYPGALEADFGSNFGNFDYESWDEFTEATGKVAIADKISLPFMPSLVRKSWFEKYGGFPLGNLQGDGGYGSVASYGDESFFRVLKSHGVRHRSVEGVFCYHFKEGERETSMLTYFSNILIPHLTWPLLRKIRRLFRFPSRPLS